jgi:hypothetical protein
MSDSTPEANKFYVPFPLGVRVFVIIDMVCADNHIHPISMELEQIDNRGLEKHIEDIRAILRDDDWRDPTPEDYKRAERERQEALAEHIVASRMKRYDA